MVKHKDLYITKNFSLLDALQKMDSTGRKLLIVTENESFFSLLSIGDIQRAIIKYNDLNIEISNILRSDIKVASIYDDPEKIKEYMKTRRNEFMPVLDEKKSIVDIIFWKDLFADEQRLDTPQCNYPVVIMAGGKGTRLKPLTNILPKALIPIGEKTIIEYQG